MPRWTAVPVLVVLSLTGIAGSTEPATPGPHRSPDATGEWLERARAWAAD